jgi:protein TonB
MKPGTAHRAAAALGRAERRSRANARVVEPVPRALRDPLDIPRPRPLFELLRAGGALGAAAALHVGVLGGFLAVNAVGDWLADQPVIMAEAEASSLAIEPPPEPEPEPEDEPVVEEPPLALPSPVPSLVPPDRPEAPRGPSEPMGLTADSTVEGGRGPAFRTGAGLFAARESLAEQLLGAAEATAPEEVVMTADAVDVPPKPAASNRPPKPPARAVKKQLSGFVTARLVIDATGEVQDVKILASEPAGVFDEAVLDVVPDWRFTPATYKGQPVEIRVDQTFRFQLE